MTLAGRLLEGTTSLPELMSGVAFGRSCLIVRKFSSALVGHGPTCCPKGPCAQIAYTLGPMYLYRGRDEETDFPSSDPSGSITSPETEASSPKPLAPNHRSYALNRFAEAPNLSQNLRSSPLSRALDPLAQEPCTTEAPKARKPQKCRDPGKWEEYMAEVQELQNGGLRDFVSDF